VALFGFFKNEIEKVACFDEKRNESLVIADKDVVQMALN
jgi:hypothetical protein